MVVWDNMASRLIRDSNLPNCNPFPQTSLHICQLLKMTSKFKAIGHKDLLVTDLTSNLSVLYSIGFEYIIVFYVSDANTILVRSIKNRYKYDHFQVYNEIFIYLEKRGILPSIHKIDNECFQEVYALILYHKKFSL